jgi:hypothetical protein
MHRIGIRRYSGAAGEDVTVDTEVAGSGAVRFVLDGVDGGATSPFKFVLSPPPGHTSQLSVGLFSEVGDTCRVDISKVDGGADPDLLVAQPHDPFPVHDYEFVTLAGDQLAQAASLSMQKKRST